MLGLRIKSALILGPIAILAAYLGSWAFALLAALCAALIGWEWSRMARGGYDKSGMLLSLAGAAAALFALINPALAFGAAALCGAFALRAAKEGSGRTKWDWMGVVYVSIPALSLVWIREQGLSTLLWLLFAVWATDIGAYAAGRLIGGPKIAPAISPNKTWAGLLGGVLSAFAISALFASFMPDPAPHWMALGLVGALIAEVAQCGDFAESAMKRRFGVKDSSSIIPGHGGVMDRLDGLLAAAPLTALFCLAFGGGVSLWP